MHEMRKLIESTSSLFEDPTQHTFDEIGNLAEQIEYYANRSRSLAEEVSRTGGDDSFLITAAEELENVHGTLKEAHMSYGNTFGVGIE